MSLEHSPIREVGGAGGEGDAEPRAPPDSDLDYWNALVNEKTAATYLGVTHRMMQAMRQRGGGPEYTVLSVRCIRYTRARLRAWSEAHLRSSTADPGPEEATA